MVPGFPCTLDGFDRVPSEFSDELQRVTVLAEPVEEKADVMNGHRKKAMTTSGG